MTTAHRPTWTPAVGGASKSDGKLGVLSKQYSVRDQAAHTKLKTRKPGQGISTDLPEDFKADLLAREDVHFKKRKVDEAGAIAAVQEEADKRLKAIEQLDPDLDADDPVNLVDDDDDADDDDDDDDDDDEAELLRELQKIKEERAIEAAEREAAKNAAAEKIQHDVYMHGNPLLSKGKQASDFSVSRRWDDDVVFKNCAKKPEDTSNEFVNDTLRSQFHRRFMDKYIK